MSVFERLEEGRIGVAFPHQQAQRFRFWSASSEENRQNKNRREQRSLHPVLPLHRPGADALKIKSGYFASLLYTTRPPTIVAVTLVSEILPGSMSNTFCER